MRRASKRLAAITINKQPKMRPLRQAKQNGNAEVPIQFTAPIALCLDHIAIYGNLSRRIQNVLQADASQIIFDTALQALPYK